MQHHSAYLLFDARAKLGEGALWDSVRQRLLWVDILGHTANLFDPATGENRAYPAGAPVGTIVPTASGQALIALGRGVSRLNLDSGEITPFTAPLEPEGSRLNDGKCDPQGRLWVGGMGKDARLHVVFPDGHAESRLEGVRISNGITWSRDGRTMHYIDTPTRRVQVFDFDPDTATISQRTTWPEVTSGHPDGSTVDADGGVWVCFWDGWRVDRYDSETGRVTDTIAVPAARVTSCAFGGPNLDTLYITTSRHPDNAPDADRQPHSGGIFTAKVGRLGLPAHRFAS
jgi:sugar lactone lactonase YvrE